MAVYVDDFQVPWRGMIMSHMTADSIEELHLFAARLGLKRSWAQVPPAHSIPHYDVSEGKRQLAIRLGAIEEDFMSSAARSTGIVRNGSLRGGGGLYPAGGSYAEARSFTE